MQDAFVLKQVNDLHERFEDCLDAFDEVHLFTGPSVYFHQKTIALRRKHPGIGSAIDDSALMEALYATLTAWGMHRMGATQAKLGDFDKMWESFKQEKEFLQGFQYYRLGDMTENEIPTITAAIWAVISHLEVGIGKVKLVSGSKALHHLLPDLVPPIDREYTLQFFQRSKNISDSGEKEFEFMFPFLHRIGQENRGVIIAALARGGEMYTSFTKVIDNAIVGHRLLGKGKSATGFPTISKSKVQAVDQAPLPIFPQPREKKIPIAEQIIQAVKTLTTAGKEQFSRQDIRDMLQIDVARFSGSYNPIIQGMRADQPGGAPSVGEKYRGVFRQVERGTYCLTEYGWQLIGLMKQ